jgi:Cu(I)/Ag(I) efflux system protein CusF
MKILSLAAGLAALAAAPALAQTAGHAGHDMAGMEMSAAAKTGQGVGQVKAVDAKAGRITLHHGPIPALGWPAMTMPFKAAPALLQGVKAGQTVKFTVTDGSEPTVTAIAPQ